MSRITINGVTFDPLAQRAAFAATTLASADAINSDYILIQTTQPLTRETKGTLTNMGVAVLEYVPEDTYLCNYTGTDLNQIRALPTVAWVNTYLQGFKVPPTLMPEAPVSVTSTRNLLEVAATPISPLSTTPTLVDVVFHSNVDPETVREQIATAAHLDASGLVMMSHKTRLNVQAQYLNNLAGIDGVRHIEEVSPMQLHNNVAREILTLDPPPPTTTLFDGQGQTVAVADTGFDTGSTTDVHEAFTGRVRRLYSLGRTNNASDPDGHGTHVAGSVLGDGNSAALGHRVQGTAPAAELVLQSVLDSSGGLGGLPFDLENLFQPPYEDDGARVHTNSWGSTRADGRYDSNSEEVDEFVWNNRDCVICFAAGNSGEDRDANGVIDPRSVTPPGTAKNCITVGASENNRPNFNLPYGQAFGYPADPIASDPMASNPDGMVAFSSRGPTADGRIKPDVVAPGSYVLSARSRTTTGNGWARSDDPLYYFIGGTSMATPLVAGCTAVLRQYLATDHQMANPSAALVKALLINGATDMAGQYVPSEAASIPNNSEGFGRVDMAKTLNGAVQLRDEATELDTGDEETTTVTVGAGAELKVTLVWTDRPGATLQNDLDLIVRTANGQERHGNVAPNSTAFDRTNNVEQVIWDDLPAGSVDIIVRAHRIPLFPQSYALVTRIEGGGTTPPPEPPELPELAVNGPEVLGEINPAGEEDLYALQVTAPGTYTIETSGLTDTFLSLFGPNSQTSLVAADDDSGPGLLSLIVEELTVVGTYYVQVRHFSPAGQGAYGISVRSNTNPPAVQLQVNGPEVQGDIGQPEESDLFTFTVTATGRYVMETTGSTDTFLSLFGPNSDTTLIAQDDDSGPGTLSRIEESLAPGTYFARVRHFSPNRTGAYGVRVRTA